jgi:sugar phosphate isomerase/epimerase
VNNVYEKKETTMNRRAFLKNSLAMAGAACGIPCGSSAQAPTDAKQPLPLKIGIRAATMKMAGNFDVIKTAAGMAGIMGVELQATSGKPNLRDWDTVRRYKREADRWAMRIPTLAGVWDRGVNISSPAAAESIRLSIRAAEMLGSSALLLAFFKKDAPDMTKKESYGPIVAMLREVAPRAADAGVVLGLENSLSPADNAKLVDLVGHPAVGVYYDLHNMAFYGYGDHAIPGVKLLGKQRICAVHVKNDDKLLEEPGPIDWAAAFRAFNDIGYEGWYVYETSHASLDDCIEDTKKNNAFLRQHARMPAV